MPCNPLTDLTGCLGPAATGQATSSPTQGWNAICESFATAAQQLLGSFAKAFVAIPPVNLSYAGVRSVYGLSLELAALIAAVLLMFQVIRTVLVHDGSAIAQGLIGIGKATLAFVLTLGAAATALRASDELTRWIIGRTFGSPAALSVKLAHLAAFNPSVSSSLLLILALLGILLTVALWGQLLVRNIAVTVLVAVSPIAAAGQITQATQQWWRKLVRVTIQLIALKPVVALIFAVGLTMPGADDGLEKLLAGMLVLLLAGCAWPAMARLSAVVEVYVSGGALAGLRGGAGGRLATGSPGGVAPADLSRVAEARTMAAVHEFHSRSADPGRAASPSVQLTSSLRAGLGGRPRSSTAPQLASAQLASAQLASAQLASAQLARAQSGGAPSAGGLPVGDAPPARACAAPAGRAAPAAGGLPANADADADGKFRLLADLEPGPAAAPGSWRTP